MQRNSDKILTEWLVLNTQNGSLKALDQLLKIWYPKFLRYSTRQLGDTEIAKDAVQDTLVTVAKRIKNLKDPVAYPKWAYQILHRRGIDYLRKELKNREIKQAKQEEIETFNSQITNDSEFNGKIELARSLSRLNKLQYQLIHLHYLEGFTIKEISDIIKIPQGSVKSKLHYARHKLRTLLEEKL